jgi:hypothetical protein
LALRLSRDDGEARYAQEHRINQQRRDDGIARDIRAGRGVRRAEVQFVADGSIVTVFEARIFACRPRGVPALISEIATSKNGFEIATLAAFQFTLEAGQSGCGWLVDTV